MKLRLEHIQALREGIGSRIHGASTMRERWDSLWAAIDARDVRDGLLNEIYQYANDDHIDTVLRLLASEGHRGQRQFPTPPLNVQPNRVVWAPVPGPRGGRPNPSMKPTMTTVKDFAKRIHASPPHGLSAENAWAWLCGVYDGRKGERTMDFHAVAQKQYYKDGHAHGASRKNPADPNTVLFACCNDLVTTRKFKSCDNCGSRSDVRGPDDFEGDQAPWCTQCVAYKGDGIKHGSVCEGPGKVKIIVGPSEAQMAGMRRNPEGARSEVRSPTSTRTEVRSPTSTSTEAHTSGNFTATVTGGAGAGATNVAIYPSGVTSKGRGKQNKSAQLSQPGQNIQRKNPQRLSMTYGVLPTKAVFAQHFNAYVPEGIYAAVIKGTHTPLISSGDYDVEALWALVKKLKFAYERGDEDAGDWASTILETLGMEWI